MFILSRKGVIIRKNGSYEGPVMPVTEYSHLADDVECRHMSSYSRHVMFYLRKEFQSKCHFGVRVSFV